MASRLFATFSALTLFALVFSRFKPTETYDSRDPSGNITIKWDILSWTPDGYVSLVTIYNFQQHRRIQAPGWMLGWTWAKKEVIWSVVGAMTTEDGDCSRFKRYFPDCCSRDPHVVDLLPSTPDSQQVPNCCKGGVLDYNEAVSFQISVGLTGTTNTTVRVPKNFTLNAPGPRYTCGAAKVGKPTGFATKDGRRVTRALVTWNVICKVYMRRRS